MMPAALDVATRTGDAAALLTVAEGLTRAGFDVQSPEWERSSYMKISNAWGELCELTITEFGALTWEWRSCQGAAASPDRLTAIALDLLGASRPPGSTPPNRDPGTGLKSAVGQALARSGLAVALKVLGTDDSRFEVYAEVEAVNPARPARGRVRVADDSAMWWDCRLVPLAGGPGLELAEITGTLTRVLAAGRR